MGRPGKDGLDPLGEGTILLQSLELGGHGLAARDAGGMVHQHEDGQQERSERSHATSCFGRAGELPSQGEEPQGGHPDAVAIRAAEEDDAQAAQHAVDPPRDREGKDPDQGAQGRGDEDAATHQQGDHGQRQHARDPRHGRETEIGRASLSPSVLPIAVAREVAVVQEPAAGEGEHELDGLQGVPLEISIASVHRGQVRAVLHWIAESAEALEREKGDEGRGQEQRSQGAAGVPARDLGQGGETEELDEESGIVDVEEGGGQGHEQGNAEPPRPDVEAPAAEAPTHDQDVEGDVPVEAQREMTEPPVEDEGRGGEGHGESRGPGSTTPQVAGHPVEGEPGGEVREEQQQVRGLEHPDDPRHPSREPEERLLGTRVVVPVGPVGGVQVGDVGLGDRDHVAVLGRLQIREERDRVPSVVDRSLPGLGRGTGVDEAPEQGEEGGERGRAHQLLLHGGHTEV